MTDTTTAPAVRAEVDLQAGDLRDALDTVAPAMAAGCRQPVLAGVRWNLATGELVATDSYRMHFTKLPVRARCGPTILLPAESVRAMIKRLPKRERWQNVRVIVSSVTHTVTFQIGGTVYGASFNYTDPEGYPAVDKLIPTADAWKTSIRVGAELSGRIEDAVHIATAFDRIARRRKGSDATGSPVTLRCAPPDGVALEITGERHTPGLRWEDTAGPLPSGDFGPVSFNPAFLLAAVKAAGQCAVLELQADQVGKCARIRGVDGWALLMPVRLP